MSTNSRRAVTVRFTEEEYEVLRELSARFGNNEKHVLKFAFALLAESTGKLEQRIQEEKPWDAKAIPTEGIKLPAAE